MPHLDLITTLNRQKSDKEDLLDRIDQLESAFNSVEPTIRAFIPEEDRFVRLRREARELYDQYPDPQSRPPLFGLLAGVKDIFHVDGFPTKAGSKLPAEVLSGGEARVVTKMRGAGALIAGKTVTTEFAYFAPGPTRNPHNPAHTPGGSSSGSAAAVAAGLVPFATGTQTIGSISRPASYCGVAGYKPSYGRISAQGVIPLAPSVDHVGFFASDVLGARFMAEFLVDDWNSHQSLQRMPALGIPAGPYLDHASDEMLDHFEGVYGRLSAAGYSVKKAPVMLDFEKVREYHNTIVAAEAASTHRAWFEAFASLYHPKTADLILRGQRISSGELHMALDGRERLRNELEQATRKHEIDLWISPGAPGPAPKGLESTGDPVMNLPWTYAGLPTVCIASGKNKDGLPLGLQIAGGWRQDEALLDWAAKLERNMNRRTG